MRMMFTYGERLPQEYKEYARELAGLLCEDVVALRRLSRAPRFTASVYWPTPAHLALEIEWTEALIACLHEESQADYVGDDHWIRSRTPYAEAQAHREAAMRLEMPCLATPPGRPRYLHCPDERHRARRTCEA